MHDLLPQPEITAALLQGVEFSPETEALPECVQFSSEQQVMGFAKPRHLLGYLAVEPEGELGAADIVAIKHHFRDTKKKVATVQDPNGLHLFNTQEALTASLRTRPSTDLVYVLYALEVNDDNLDARPYSKLEWLRSAFWRPPRYGGGTKLHGPSLGTTIRYQMGRANYLVRNFGLAGEVETEPPTEVLPKPEATEPSCRLAIPHRRLSVFTGVLYRLGAVQESRE